MLLLTAVLLHYQVTCNHLRPEEFPALHAEVRFENPERVQRVLLPAAVNEVPLIIPDNASNTPEIHVFPHPKCNLSQPLETSALKTSEEEALAFQHAPFLAVRPDQKNNRENDVPLLLTYKLSPTGDGGQVLEYLIYFSAEDSLTSTAATEAFMGEQGRRLDIEWIYRVYFSDRMKVLRREYQGGIFLGMGHSTKQFHGDFLPHTENPILYNITNHNVFSDKPTWGGPTPDNLVGHQLFPVPALAAPSAREELLYTKYPWMIELSDREYLREKHLLQKSDRYLYVQLNGKLHKGQLGAKITTAEGETYVSGNGQGGKVSSFGNGQAYLAVPLKDTGANLGQTFHGKLSLVASAGTEVSLNELKFFILTETTDNPFAPAWKEISEKFNCSLEGLNSNCLF